MGLPSRQGKSQLPTRSERTRRPPQRAAEPRRGAERARRCPTAGETQKRAPQRQREPRRRAEAQRRTTDGRRRRRRRHTHPRTHAREERRRSHEKGRRGGKDARRLYTAINNRPTPTALETALNRATEGERLREGIYHGLKRTATAAPNRHTPTPPKNFFANRAKKSCKSGKNVI